MHWDPLPFDAFFSLAAGSGSAGSAGSSGSCGSAGSGSAGSVFGTCGAWAASEPASHSTSRSHLDSSAKPPHRAWPRKIEI